jgi:hypothetical protein
MSARRWYWVGGTVMIVVVVIVYLVRRDSGQISAEQINMERYDEIKLGMNREDVEEILGGPPGSYYTTGETRHRKEIHFPPPELSGCKEEFWAGNDFEISVFFDKQGRVSGKDIVGLYDPNPLGRFTASPLAKRGKEIRTYNDQDAELVRKVEAAVAQKVPHEKVESFVGTDARVNTWNEKREFGLDLSADEWSGPPLRMNNQEKFTAWTRPSVSKDEGPAVVGILWREDGSAMVFVGILIWH